MPLVLLGLVVLASWAGLVRLSVAFLRLELHWTYVAEQSRRGAPWPYRLAGVWGGMDGSLLLFGAIVATAVLAAIRAAPTVVRWVGLATGVVPVATCLVLASPFRRLPVPSTQGFGLNPILEHPMMAIHPPLLYSGLAAAAGAAFAAAGRGASARWPAARGWLLWCVGLLTISMTLGAAWSYVEQGWGGYWAWDPVENSSLIVWLAGLVALHVAPLTRPTPDASSTRGGGSRRCGSEQGGTPPKSEVPGSTRWKVHAAAIAAPWVLGLFGAALVRSGRTPSVHGFAEQPDIGLALFLLAVATAVAAGCDVHVFARRTGPLAADVATSDGGLPAAGASTAGVRAEATAGGLAGARALRPSVVAGPVDAVGDRPGDQRSVAVALLAAATVLVILGTAYPVVSTAFGATISAVRGEYFARTVGPLAVVMVPFLVIQLRRTRSWSRVAHAGALLLIVGAGVSTFDRHDTISVAPGATQLAAGVEVTNDGLDIRTGNRLGTDEVVANLRVDGRTMTPRLVVYRDRGGRLAEIAVHTGWTTDTHAVLEDAFDNGAAVVTIHRRHGMWLVWVGTALIALGTIAAHRRRSTRRGLKARPRPPEV